MRFARRGLSVAAAISLAAATPMAGTAFAQSEPEEKSASWITIRYNKSSETFKGAVGSRYLCRRFRVVQIKKKRAGRPNLVVARDTTSQTGNYRVSRRYQSGRYYAVVKPKTVQNQEGESMRCMWDRSVTIKK